MPRTKKKVKPIVKTKVISARVTEVVHELLHQQAEDAGMTLSECSADADERSGEYLVCVLCPPGRDRSHHTGICRHRE